jgi:L-ascorbate metabolism protein UlaG (beta-lactamase superfamily)
VAEAPWKRHVVPAQLKTDEVRITFVGHSTFLVESGKGIKIVTDYNDYVVPSDIPEVATMNRAHDTHFSLNPDKRIRHVLKGWSETGGAAQHNIVVGDVRVRNVPTNIRGWSGGMDGSQTGEFGNSIFIFEVAGLCIAHLGHLHHTLTPQQLSQIGRMDIVMFPVDGSYTLDIDGMISVLRSLSAPIMIPMHYFSRFGLDRFLERVKAQYEIEEQPVPTVVLSRAKIPMKGRVLVLPGN